MVSTPGPTKESLWNVAVSLYSGWAWGSRMPAPIINPRMREKAGLDRPRTCFWPTGDTAFNVKHPFLRGIS